MCLVFGYLLYSTKRDFFNLNKLTADELAIQIRNLAVGATQIKILKSVIEKEIVSEMNSTSVQMGLSARANYSGNRNTIYANP